jgi:threonine/homoserine/homoserine lactone efflux protein
MVSTYPVIAFAVIAVVVVAIPGPSIAFTRAVTFGRRVALCTVLEHAMRLPVPGLLMTVGVGAQIERSPEILAIRTVEG